MAAISGTTGTVAMAGGFITNVHSWTINTTGEWLPTTDFGETWETGIVGVKKFNGSYVCYIDDTDALPLPNPGDVVAAFTLTAAAGRTYSGNCRIVGIDAGVSEEGDSRELTVTFNGTGALGSS